MRWAPLAVLSVVLPACDLVLGIGGEYSVAPAGSSASAGGEATTVAAGNAATTGVGTTAVGTSSGGGGDATTSGGGAGGDAATSGGGGGAGPGPVDCDPRDPGNLVDGCPVGMVGIGSSCIGAREVSFRDYNEVVELAAPCFDDVLTCSGNDPFSGNETAFADADPDLPAHPVDFCDAEAYCRVRGWRLCTREEWTFACTEDLEASPFPWGATPEPGRCVEYPDVAPVVRDDICSGVVAPRTDVHDLVGNVAEPFAGCADLLGCLAGGAIPEVPVDDVERCGMLQGVPHDDLLHDGEMPRPMPASYRSGVRCCYGPG